MAGNRLKKPPSFTSLDGFQEFWDKHDVTDFQTQEAQFAVDLRHAKNVVSIEPGIMAKVQAAARANGVGTQTLINLWLAEKVMGTRS
ncbi:MAG: hypothetical protein AUJ92_12415 [Armatimonadetes bacterium CG2_30_59_28]|nr:hypothetical protein [Armatimonadota bacterium]OIO93404.1 MAG: hypothetical protein AUJ92_12415 [Armatimonadetes bacterium CG2_30_59_28]PIU62802.1 MAG: hypothetical protein COS85_17525 [Armatimonadetes bacterium CG07_land_8_20_14_0_80_59_28]PIX39585.1 MAG: hypothetical protein COZ56_17050 [Armatimonadetes bacterium CG_4_8_14_3_um_filter_58_9]PIY37415.1 MAG: hypothetical protein COZ05_22395 [Armatimonadetes bacterium CG_4_10_14_3_um_filter_59_10]PJB63401.1 MAG: hypothetical protein CO095_165